MKEAIGYEWAGRALYSLCFGVLRPIEYKGGRKTWVESGTRYFLTFKFLCSSEK